jgi:hypothetical protein
MGAWLQHLFPEQARKTGRPSTGIVTLRSKNRALRIGTSVSFATVETRSFAAFLLTLI